MARAFQYKPKFVDIRVRPPKPEEEAAEQDVNALKPGERACDNPGCRMAATARAPKSRKMLNEHYWFCQAHASEYNRNWDFFAGMSEGEIRRRQEEEQVTGGPADLGLQGLVQLPRERRLPRPQGRGPGTVRRSLQHVRSDRPPRAPRRARAPQHRAAGAQRPGRPRPRRERRPADDPRPLHRARQRCHPDANGGDRSAEDKLQRVIRAYQMLRKSGLA
jgi:hypothetical protein